MHDAVLVTGATGFVGRHLVSALRDRGDRVVTRGSADGDIARCRLDLDGVSHVVHLAGKAFVPDSWASPREFYDVNVLGTVNVLESCGRAQVPLTYVSSYVYGRPRCLPIAEDHPLEALNPYSHSKILAEQAVRYFGSQFGVRATIVRPFNIYGPGQDERFLVPTIVRQALDPHSDRITVQDVRPRRDLLHVRDFVALLIATLSRGTGGIYNAGSGRSVAIPDLVAHVNAAVGRVKPLHAVGVERPEEVLDVVADVSRARTELAWAPRVELDEGLRDIVAWAHAQPAALR
jgi:nucleoside-diphosphate-sugar epimerase